jgi:NTE family protein
MFRLAEAYPVLQSAFDRVRNLFRTEREPCDFGLVLTGGGARAAYQAGVLQYIAEAFPEANFSIAVGISAGAINAAQIANHAGPFAEAAPRLVEDWSGLRSEDVYEAESGMRLLRSLLQRAGNGNPGPALNAVASTAPLRAYLERKLEAVDGRLTKVDENLRNGRLRAVSVVTTNYSTGQTVTWVQGRRFEHWERPNRVSVQADLTIDHILASTSLPFLFPAIQIGDAWYGDGGIRLSNPLAPAIHLGADRILAISTSYVPSRAEASTPVVTGYPPAAQIFGILSNAVFMDALDPDALSLERMNRLVDQLPGRRRQGIRPVRLLVVRPSVDLGKLSSEFEYTLPPTLALFSRLLGTGETKRPDWLSMLVFDREYIARLITIGYEDARRQRDQIEVFLDEGEMVPPPMSISTFLTGRAGGGPPVAGVKSE